MHLSRQWNCWSLTCSWSIACRRCSNYIFILNLNTWLQWIGQRQLQDEMRNINVWGLGATYIRELTVNHISERGHCSPWSLYINQYWLRARASQTPYAPSVVHVWPILALLWECLKRQPILSFLIKSCMCVQWPKKKIVMSCLAPSETDIHYESMIWNFKIQTVSLNLLWPSDAIWHGDLSQH